MVAVAAVAAALAPAATAGRPVPRHPAVRRPVGPPPVIRGPIAIARTGAASQVTPTTAILNGAIGLRGLRVRHWFQYGPSRAYPDHTRSLVGRATRGRVEIADWVRGLPALTTIHYRLVASTCGGCRRGTVYGPDHTLQTTGYENPVLDGVEGADPSVLVDAAPGGGYWAYVTGDGFPVLHSADLVHWTRVGAALARPSWVAPSGDWHPWAPDVHRVSGPCPDTASANCYVMYYVGLNASLEVNCVATAVSPSPAGPFTDLGPLGGGPGGAELPIGCGDASGLGQIDPYFFVDPASGAPYLYVSEDFACPPDPTPCERSTATLQPTLSVIPLAPDGLSAIGARQPLFSGESGTWEAAGVTAPTVEGPVVIAHGGQYYLLYSGGSWRGIYGEGWAVAASPLGPFTRSAANPILQSQPGVVSVGGSGAPVQGPHGGWWILYHGRTGSLSALRTLRIDAFGWVPGGGGEDLPAIWGPSSGPVAADP